jgi:hypothetical protein
MTKLIDEITKLVNQAMSQDLRIENISIYYDKANGNKITNIDIGYYNKGQKQHDKSS